MKKRNISKRDMQEKTKDIDDKNPVLTQLRKNRAYSYVMNGCPSCGCNHDYELVVLGQLRCGNCHEVTANYGDDSFDINDVVWDEKENEFADTPNNIRLIEKEMEVTKKGRKHVVGFLTKPKMRQYPKKVKGKIISVTHQDMSGVVVFTVKRLLVLKRKFLMDFGMCNNMLEDMGIHNASELHGEKVAYENNQVIFDRNELNPQY